MIVTNRAGKRLAVRRNIMDLIKISDNKLKIMLTPVDMQGFELSAD